MRECIILVQLDKGIKIYRIYIYITEKKRIFFIKGKIPLHYIHEASI